MNFKEKYPDFAAIEGHVKAARAERVVYLSQILADGIFALLGGLKRVGTIAARNVEAERDRRSIEADAFLKRSVPRY